MNFRLTTSWFSCDDNWGRPFARLVCVLLLAGMPLAAERVGREQVARTASAEKAQERKLTPAEAELQKRLARAQEAKSSGNAIEVTRSSEQLIALALRELGQLRLLESASSQAMALYEQSLEFENVPETRVDLAIAYLQGSQPDDCIREADRALLDDPNNARAFNALGRAWLTKGNYPNAVRSLSRAAELAPETESLYYLGTSLLATRNGGDKVRAAQVFDQMMKLAGDSGSLHVLFGRAYRDAEDMPAAIGEFRRAIEMDTRTPHAHYFLGLALMASNEWVATPESKIQFQKELSVYPRDYLANYMLGFVASSERKYEESDKYLRTAATINPGMPDPWLFMGLNAFTQGDVKQAETNFRQAILLTGADDARSNYQIRRAYIDLGRILAASGHREEAEPYLTKARELQNKVLETSQQGMSAHMREGGAGEADAIVPTAKQLAEQAAPVGGTVADPFSQVDPAVLARSSLTEKQKEQAEAQEKQLRAALGQGFSDLATSEAIRKEYRVALDHYQEAEHWDPATPGLQRNLGVAAFRARDYGEAIRGLSAALAANPNDGAGRAMLGMTYFGEEKFAEAAKTFVPLGQKGMEDAAVGYAWASALARTGELKQASGVLSEYEKGKLSPETLLLVGQLWIEVGDYARSVAALHRALQADASLPKAHYFSGQADILWEHWSEAADEFNAELALVPTDPDAKFNLGFVYLQQSRADDAVDLFRQVLVLHPDHAKAQYELGKILLDRGQMKEAIDHLEAAARLSPQTDYVHYQLQVAYRKESRIADADRELELYKELKAKSRGRTGPQPVQRP